MKELLGQIIRFGGVGAAATLLHVSIAYASKLFLPLGPYEANFLGFAGAVAVSYLGNFHWTFAMTSPHRQHLTKFVAASFLCLIISNSLIALMCTKFYLPYPAALTAILLLVPPTSFTLSKFWAFRT
jgi:putative flippase GtrA